MADRARHQERGGLRRMARKGNPAQGYASFLPQQNASQAGEICRPAGQSVRLPCAHLGSRYGPCCFRALPLRLSGPSPPNSALRTRQRPSAVWSKLDGVELLHNDHAGRHKLLLCPALPLLLSPAPATLVAEPLVTEQLCSLLRMLVALLVGQDRRSRVCVLIAHRYGQTIADACLLRPARNGHLPYTTHVTGHLHLASRSCLQDWQQFCMWERWQRLGAGELGYHCPRED